MAKIHCCIVLIRVNEGFHLLIPDQNVKVQCILVNNNGASKVLKLPFYVFHVHRFLSLSICLVEIKYINKAIQIFEHANFIKLSQKFMFQY